MSHQTDIGQSARLVAAPLGHQLTTPSLKLQQARETGKKVTNKKPTDAQKRLGNRETHTVKLSLNQSKKTGRHQPEVNVKKRQTEMNRETLRDKASHNQ